MLDHKIGTREEWTAAREKLLAHEKEHTSLGDELAQERREPRWVRVEKEYRFETDEVRAPCPSSSTAAASLRLRLHVRPELRGRLHDVLVDCRRRRRRRPAPERSRRDHAVRLPGPA
jgi:Bacterial protein of unknown function (DUF899)